MKPIILAFLLSFISLTSAAQHEQDFVTHYMEQYGDKEELSRLTVSPSMIKAILKIEDCKEDPEIESFLRSVRSVQVLTSILTKHSGVHYERVEKMVAQNTGRYRMVIEQGRQKMFARYRGKSIVEVLMFMDEKDNFLLVDITGEMTENQLQSIINSRK